MVNKVKTKETHEFILYSISPFKRCNDSGSFYDIILSLSFINCSSTNARIVIYFCQKMQTYTKEIILYKSRCLAWEYKTIYNFRRSPIQAPCVLPKQPASTSHQLDG